MLAKSSPARRQELAPPIQARARTWPMATAILDLANDAGVVVHAGR
jgi:hypothetical protein